MAEVPIQISGVLYDKTARTQQAVVLMGKASIIGLSVGGGPIIPPEEGGGPVDPGYGVPLPPGMQPHPEHPIVIPKPPVDIPPPTIWPPGPGIDTPEHPIVIPPPVDPDKPPIIPPGLITWKPVWTPDTGWIVIGFPNVPHPAPARK